MKTYVCCINDINVIHRIVSISHSNIYIHQTQSTLHMHAYINLYIEVFLQYTRSYIIKHSHPQLMAPGLVEAQGRGGRVAGPEIAVVRCGILYVYTYIYI